MTFATRRAQNYSVVRRLPAILLLIGFAVLGSGLLQDLHLRTHRLEHAAAHPHADHDAPASDHHHDGDNGGESDCGLCANLHLPRLGVGWVPLLICLGLFVAFLTLLTPQLASQRVAVRIDCRGPPVL